MPRVTRPNLGLYLDRPAVALPDRALRDGDNFRIVDGALTNDKTGWSRLGSFTLNGTVNLISEFQKADGSLLTILGTEKDLYNLTVSAETVAFLTPRYETGTVDVTNGDATVTGTGTAWTSNLSEGDQIHIGASGQTDPTATWYTVDSITSDTELELTTTYAGATDTGLNYTARLLFSGDPQDKWDSAVFLNAQPAAADHWYATNNGRDYPVRWDGSATQVTSLSSLAFKCKALKVYENMLLYLNLTKDSGGERPASMINSDVSNPEDVTNGFASELLVHQRDDAILDAREIGDALVIYTRENAVLSQFVGDPLVFVFRPAINDTGPLARHLIANFGDHHQFLAEDGLYAFDGASVASVAPQVFRVLAPQFDIGRMGMASRLFNRAEGELTWVIPLVTDSASGTASGVPELGWSEFYLEDVGRGPTPVSKRNMPFSAAALIAVDTSDNWEDLTELDWEDWQLRWGEGSLISGEKRALVGDGAGQVYELNVGVDADGSAQTSEVCFGRFAVVDGSNRGLLRRIYPHVEVNPGINLRVTSEMLDSAEGTEAIQHLDLFDMAQEQGAHFVAPYRRGRFAQIKMGVTGQGESYTITGYDTESSRGGRR